jgi:hypothetical protein
VDYFNASFNVTTVTEYYFVCPVTICRVTVYDAMTRTTVTVTVTTIHHSSSQHGMAKADHVRQHGLLHPGPLHLPAHMGA